MWIPLGSSRVFNSQTIARDVGTHVQVLLARLLIGNCGVHLLNCALYRMKQVS